MNDWKVHYLGELIHIKHGFAFQSKYFQDEMSEYVLLTPGNFAIGGGFQANKNKYYLGPVPKEYILEPRDLIITMTDLSKAGDTLGYSALVPSTADVSYLHNQRLGKVEILSEQLLDKNYLSYLLRTKDYRDEILASATGTSIRHTSPSRILDYRFLLPPLAEQRAIAEMLASLDDKIEANRRENETLEAIARAIFKSWFVDFDPVHAKSRGELPVGMDEETAQLFPDAFVESELGLIPQGWEIKRLDEIATYLNGLALQKYPAKNETDFLPIIKIRELRQGITDGSSHRASNAIPSAYIVHDGDVLFSWSGSLLVDLWAGGDGALNQHLFKVNSDNYPRWLYYFWTLFYLDEFIQIAEDKATTMGHIKRQHLSEACVVVPNSDVISALTLYLEPYLEAIVNNRITSRTLTETRDALLPKLMSGEVRVGEVDLNTDKGL